MRTAPFLKLRAAGLASLLACVCLASHADSAPETFKQLLDLDTSSAQQYAPASVRLTLIREIALREAAQTLGVQYGLRDRSREIEAQLQEETAKLDAHYRFGALSLGLGFLPPVISKAIDPRALEGNVIHAAKFVYVIDEPPRAFIVAPTWRDWLYTGLNGNLQPQMPDAKVMYPQDSAETEFYKTTLKQAYEAGRQTATDAFNLNLAQLDRTYDGMRRYYDLVKRGMASAPVIASATQITDTHDPNTMIVGGTVIRVTEQVKFIGQTDKWVPLGN
jgi:defect-in-organelle-trafficking protein DotC